MATAATPAAAMNSWAAAVGSAAAPVKGRTLELGAPVARTVALPAWGWPSPICETGVGALVVATTGAADVTWGWPSTSCDTSAVGMLGWPSVS